jgi:DNA recombination protein RmuC
VNAILPFVVGLSLGAMTAALVARALFAARAGTSATAREAELAQRFAALSADALRQNNAQFLQLARTELERSQQAGEHALALEKQAIGELLAPLKRDLEKYDARVSTLDRSSGEALAALAERLAAVDATSARLGAETANLVKALRAPQVRGRWGEMQLKRVVEVAGMVEHCDFTQQHTVSDGDARLRPDMVVRLPGGKTVVVDAKAPLGAYLDAAECADDAVRAARLAQHAAQVRAHIDGLSRKSYWDQFERPARPSSSCCSCPARRSSPPRWSRTRR